jgi:hypothetical protein
LTTADCPFAVLPDPNVGLIEVADCNSNILPGDGGITYVNSTLPCACGSSLPDPVLYVNPLTLNLGAEATEGQFIIANSGGGSLVWNVSESIPWLDATPTSGAGNTAIEVTIDRSGLMPGSHSGLIQITSNGGNETVTVNFEVPIPNPILMVSPAVLKFSATDDFKQLVIQNGGTGELLWNIASDQPWLTVDPTSGSDLGGVNVYVDRTGLGDGTHYGNLMVTSNGGDAPVHVEMIVATQPVLSVVPTILTFSDVVTSRVFSVANNGFGTLTWSLSADESWIEIIPPLSGAGNATVSVNVDPANVPPGGTQTGHVTVSSNGGTQVVEIRFVPPGPTQGGDIGVFADTGGAGCNIVDATPGLLELYVVHMNTGGATASQFAAPLPSCMTGVSWLSDLFAYPVTTGNSQTSIAIAYGTCLASPIHVLTIQCFASGLSETCCMYPVVPAVEAPSGQIEVVDCSFTLVYGNGLISSVNADATCMCGAVRVEESTWGKIKAIYAPEHLKAIPRKR